MKVERAGMQYSKIKLGKFEVMQITAQALAAHLLESMTRKQERVLFFANSNFVVKCDALAPQMRDESVLVVNDGVALDIAAWLIRRQRFTENLNGTDFTPYLLGQASRPLRIFLLGAKPQVVVQAAQYARQVLGQEVVGWIDGYSGMSDLHLCERITCCEPDLLLVALGNPIQERWVLQHRSVLRVPLILGVGALFDFWAGAKPRAPAFVRRLRMEWFYRLCLEPRRLARRYTLDIARFLLYCYRYR